MDEIFSKAFKDEKLFFKYAKGKRDIFGKEFHNFHEIFLFLKGEAEFISEEQKILLKPGTLLVIPKEKYHQFNVRGPESDYVRCVFNFFDVPEFSSIIEEKMKTIFILETNDFINYIFEKSKNIINENISDNIKSELYKSLLLMLLYEIKPEIIFKDIPNNLDKLTIQCIDYINKNLMCSITASEISNYLNVSSSYLSHKFKKDMNISLYKFILEKKIIVANQKIMSGENPTQVASDCGFSDYSGFYKQFKKMFGKPPSKA